MYPLRKPTADHSCLAISANSLISFRSRVALSPSSPGQVENVVVPTLNPMDASFVMWLRGLEAMMAGMPRPSLSQSACSLFAHSAVVLAGTFALNIKCLRWNWVTPLVVPAAIVIDVGRGFRVNMLVLCTWSSSLKSLDTGPPPPPPRPPPAALSFFKRVVLMSMKPTFCSTDIFDNKSLARSSLLRRQSSYLSSCPFLFRSLNCMPFTVSSFAERVPSRGCLVVFWAWRFKLKSKVPVSRILVLLNIYL